MHYKILLHSSPLIELSEVNVQLKHLASPEEATYASLETYQKLQKVPLYAQQGIHLFALIQDPLNLV